METLHAGRRDSADDLIVTVVCDERHAENGTGLHVASGFCRACAEVYVALNLFQQHYAMCDGTLTDGTPVHKDSYRRGVHDGQLGHEANARIAGAGPGGS